jgi:hypothetical protein
METRTSPTVDSRFTFERADTVAERIMDIVRQEMKRPDFSPVQVFAGQLLVIVGFSRTAPAPRPVEMDALLSAVDLCLKSIAESMIEGSSANPLNGDLY